MQQLKIRRLTEYETQREQRKCDPSWVGDILPPQAPIKWIVQHIGKTDRTIARYRKVLMTNCLEYQTIACLNGIDSPVLLSRQIELLEEFSDLVDTYRDIGLAIAVYNRSHPDPYSDRQQVS